MVNKCHKCQSVEATSTVKSGDYEIPVCKNCKEDFEVQLIYDKIQPGIEAIFNELNGGRKDHVVKAFALAIDHEHRYLQGEFFIMLWKFFHLYGSKKESEYDARNEGAVKWARKWDESV